jgi:hypothetical protein
MSSEAFFHEKSFSRYLGKALLTFALVAPVSYCSIEQHRAELEADSLNRQTLAELQAACITQRGDWSTFHKECSFDD